MLKQSTENSKAAIYIRVSTDEQAQDGYGLDVQKERCAAQITAKGWRCVGIYEDAGISGTKTADERDGLRALMEAAAAREFDAIVVLSLDRIGRNTRVVLDIVERLSAIDIDIVSCKESFDTSTPQGKFVLTIFAALAQLERDTIVERTTAGRNMRGKIDGERGGRIPYGYRRIEGRIEVFDQEANIVRGIFAMRKAKATLRAIASTLNAAQATPPVGEHWYASSVKSILDNADKYRGGLRGESDVAWVRLL